MKQMCPINLRCQNYPCPNYYTCKNLGISWEIPYYRNVDGLFVKKYGWRRTWTAESLWFGSPMNRCSINGTECGYYKPVAENDENYDAHPNEMNRRMVESWREAGFVAAEEIEDYKQRCQQEESIKQKVLISTDEIPF